MSTTGLFKSFCKRGHPRSKDSVALNNTCKECKKEWARSRHGKSIRRKYTKTSKHQEYMKQYSTEWHLKTTFGITKEEYNNLLLKQNSSCAICKIPQDQLKRALAVDHDHKTNRVRGLLCNLCNSMVLNVAENYSHLLPRAFDYLNNN